MRLSRSDDDDDDDEVADAGTAVCGTITRTFDSVRPVIASVDRLLT